MAASTSADRVLFTLKIFIFISLFIGDVAGNKKWKRNSIIVKINNPRDFREVTGARYNVLVVFARSDDSVDPIRDTLVDVGEGMLGRAIVMFIDCSMSKAVCQKKQIETETFELHHYMDGKFNKVYDRQLTSKSIITFLMDPYGILPWSEELYARDVVLLETHRDLKKLLEEERRPTLIMCYSAWSAACRRLKPEFSAAATELKNEAVLVGIESDSLRFQAFTYEYNVRTFPVLLYFENGQYKFRYGGEYTKNGIISWMKNPVPGPESEEILDWQDEETEVVHLTDNTFHEIIAREASILVIFYRPEDPRLERLRIEYERAAVMVNDLNITGILAAVDVTREMKLAGLYRIRDPGNAKYFRDGEEIWDVAWQGAKELVHFMKNPQKPIYEEEVAWEDMEDSVQHLTDESFKEFTANKKHTFVMFYAPWCGHCHKAKPEFIKAADNMAENKELAFAAVDCTKFRDFCKSKGVSGYPSYKYYYLGEGEVKYSGKRQAENFESFVKSPPTVLSTAQMWGEVVGREHVLLLTASDFDSTINKHEAALVMFYAPWCSHCNGMKAGYGDAAKTIKSMRLKAVLAAVDGTAELDLAKRFNIQSYPTLRYFRNGDEKYTYEGERSSAAIVEFIRNPVDPGKPPPPTSWSEQPNLISHLTIENFQYFLSTKPVVLVLFYLPWCPHCQKAKPQYMEAAEQFKDSIDFYIAAIDCVEYATVCQESGVSEYPLYKVYVRGRYHSDYTGDRSSADIGKHLHLFKPKRTLKDEL